ncbi:MAG TPA: hypothetical protein VFV93_00355 [Thermomicrobiales bacterium]|nr:hypothetical protein [Thermomicrobiales bacterium]
MLVRRTSPALFWITAALLVILLGFGIANLTGLGYPPGDERWRTFVGLFSVCNALFLLAGLLLSDYRSRFGTALLVLAALVAGFTFAPWPIVFQVHALAIVFLAIRRARQRTRPASIVAA